MGRAAPVASSTRWVALGPLGSIWFLWSAKSHKIGDWELGVAGVGMTASGQFGFAVAIISPIAGMQVGGGVGFAFRDSGARRHTPQPQPQPQRRAPPKHRTQSHRP
jgi:hypothetical protein